MTRPAGPHHILVLSWCALGIVILLAFVRAAVDGWPLVFDDAFITYRYAQNLALGHGITWNVGQPPTEGYTNFLLVVLIAPWIKAGIDPLLVTRILSYAAVLTIAAVLFTQARRRFDAPAWIAVLVAAVFLIAPDAKFLPLTGLETVVYACLLLLTLVHGVGVIERRTVRVAVEFSLLLTATALLRPEAVLLFPVVVGVFLIAVKPRTFADLKPLAASVAILSVLAVAYVGWKLAHFQAVLPNPFYVKAAGGGLVSELGVRSVRTFVTGYAVLLSFSIVGVVLGALSPGAELRRNRWLLVTGAAFITVYALFFLRADTLMDIHGRFLFPLVPIAVLLAAPALHAALAGLHRLAGPRLAPMTAVATILLAIGTADLVAVFSNARRLVTGSAHDQPSGLMSSELNVARALARFPEITAVRIAFADAGVIPYFTGAQWLDVVGLNDSYLARTRDRQPAVDYFFRWAPDLVIHPGSRSDSWIRHGHGPLGDYQSWATDPRWDAYDYVGTTHTGGRYDLQYFVRRSSPFRESLGAFLKSTVVDGWYDQLPLPIGTYSPAPEADVRWVPRAFLSR
jgi:hypothetical protein